jgi:hypothetical protein
LADTLDRQATAVEATLFDVHLTGAREDAFRNPMQLYGRLAALQSDMAENGADFAPTAQQLAVHTVLAERLAAAAARFADLFDKAVPAFSAELRKAALKDIIAGLDATAPPAAGP